MSDTEALVPRGELVQLESRAIVRPALSVEDTLSLFDDYQRLKEGLDRRMPGAVIEIQGKRYRTKSYWDAIGVVFNLDSCCVSEEAVTQGDDWGYMVLYRATAPNGRSTVGDGCCFASELEARRRQVTTHNVRSMAHTRSLNRAISRLVGFGEVSAEEAEQEDGGRPGPRIAPRRAADRPTGEAAVPPPPPSPPPRPPDRA